MYSKIAASKRRDPNARQRRRRRFFTSQVGGLRTAGSIACLKIAQRRARVVDTDDLREACLNTYLLRRASTMFEK